MNKFEQQIGKQFVKLSASPWDANGAPVAAAEDAGVAEAKRMDALIEAAAEAAHDTHYCIGQHTSDYGYALESRDVKAQWREVALAVIKAIGAKS